MEWSQASRCNRLCVIVSSKRGDVLIGKYNPCICPNKDSGSYKRRSILVRPPGTPKSRLASPETFRVFGRQVDSFTDCSTPAPGLMTSDRHVVIQVKNIGEP
jgi:hypothetical protein